MPSLLIAFLTSLINHRGLRCFFLHWLTELHSSILQYYFVWILKTFNIAQQGHHTDWAFTVHSKVIPNKLVLKNQFK